MQLSGLHDGGDEDTPMGMVVTTDDATGEHISMFFCDQEGTASSFHGIGQNKNGEPVVTTQLRDIALPKFAITGLLLDASRFPRIQPERVYGMLLA